jgi:hypothetical protein
MTDAEKRLDWVHWVGHGPKSYLPNALCAVYEKDGQKMLHAVLKEMKLERTEDLILMMAK